MIKNDVEHPYNIEVHVTCRQLGVSKCRLSAAA